MTKPSGPYIVILTLATALTTNAAIHRWHWIYLVVWLGLLLVWIDAWMGWRNDQAR